MSARPLDAIANCLLCGEPGELRHTMDGSALVRRPNVCMVTALAPGVTDKQAIETWNAVHLRDLDAIAGDAP